MVSDFQFNKDHERWIKSACRKYKKSTQFWKDLILKQGGKCGLTGAPLLFDANSGTAKRGGQGCHPLYASVDHINPNREDYGFQILCYDINDLKAHLPLPLFNALTKTREWKEFVQYWKRAAESSPNERKVFKQLIDTGASTESFGDD